MGLPRLLPPVLRLRAAALAGAALPRRRSRRSSSACRWRSAGALLLEIVFGVLFAVSVVAWSATALDFGRVPALASAVLLLVYPAWATLYHQASSDAVFATGPRALGARRSRGRSDGRPRGASSRSALGIAVARPDPAREPGAAPGRPRAAPRGRARGGAASPGSPPASPPRCCRSRAGPSTTGSATTTLTVARGGRAWVPFLRVWLADRTIAPENGPASRRLAGSHRAARPDRGAVQRASTCRSTRTSPTGRTTRPCG